MPYNGVTGAQIKTGEIFPIFQRKQLNFCTLHITSEQHHLNVYSTYVHVHVHHKMLLVKMTKLKIYLSITHVNQRGIVGRLKQLEVEQFSIKELPRQAHVPGDRSPTHIIGKHCSLHPRHKQRGQVDTAG